LLYLRRHWAAGALLQHRSLTLYEKLSSAAILKPFDINQLSGLKAKAFAFRAALKHRALCILFIDLILAGVEAGRRLYGKVVILQRIGSPLFMIFCSWWPSAITHGCWKVWLWPTVNLAPGQRSC
jgi:hypothetical protein